MRTLTGNTTTKTQTRLATEPVMILEINWSTGVQYYGDKTFTLDAHSIQGKLLEFSPLQATGKQDTSGEVSSASITLDDVDGTLKTLVNTIIMEGTIVTAYHHYEGNSWSDLTLVFRGKIGGTITWDEGQRQLSFDIESYIDDAEIGYAPEENEITNMNNDVAGVMWPIVFGGVRRLKAIPILHGGLGNNTDGIFGGWPSNENTPFEVENGDKFPQGVNMHIVVNMTRFYGYFEGNIFHRSESNLLWYTDVALAPRVAQDPDAGNKKVVWLANNEDLTKKQCWPGVKNYYNYCERQEGNKCWFMFDWTTLLDNTTTFTEVRGNVHNTWYEMPSFLNWWYIKPRCQVYEYAKSYSDLFIVNEYPSSQVVEVFAKRTFDGEEIWAPVPSSYYNILLNYSFAGRNVTAIQFPTPLYAREDEQWKDDIFVSVRSTLPNNVADIIQWIVQNYTSYGIDTAAFAQARIDVAPYPANFALFAQRNVLDLIEDIAWQARCAIFVHNGVISLKYLSKDMPSNYTMTRTDVLLKQLKLGFVPTESIYTKLTGTWKIDYSGEELTEKQIIYKNNINLFGLRTQERDIFIYNIEELAKMTVYFWGYRYSNSWRTMQYPTLLRTLPLELFDCATHSLSILSTYMIRGIIEDISHDSVINEISIATQLCSKAGQHTGGQPIEDAYFWIGDPAYVVTPRAIVDPLNGLQIVDYVVPVITTNQTNTNDNKPPVDEKYKYVFILPTQDQIERGVNFSITIQLQDLDGKRIYNNVTANLSLASEDIADRLSGAVVEKQINLVNGEYIATEQITGGTTQVNSATLSCSDDLLRDNYATGTSELFSIIGVKTGVLTWVSGPTNPVKRGVLFAVDITGAADGELIDVEWLFTDVNDKLYNEAGVQVTRIGFTPTGYSANWYIAGGGGAEPANAIRLKDTLNNTYADSDSSPFNISAADFVQSLVQTISINPVNRDELDPDDEDTNGGGLIVNPPHIDLTWVIGDPTGEVELQVQLLDSDDNLIDYDGAVVFEAYDADGNEVNFLLPVSGQKATIAMVDGTAYDTFEFALTFLNTSPLTVYVSMTYQSILLEDMVTHSFIIPQGLIQTFNTSSQVEQVNASLSVSAPTQITRGSAFNITLQAMVGDAADATYVPAGNIDFTLVGTLNGEVIVPTFTDNTGWSNGSKVVSGTINGGSGSKIITIEAED